VSVVAHAISVVVRRESIERVWPRGLAGYASDLAAAGYCADDHLTRVGFTEDVSVRDLLDRLQELGLSYSSESEYLDIAVVLQKTGTSVHCAWLSFANDGDGYSYCWLIGTQPGELAAPPGWKTIDSVAWDRKTQGDPIRSIPAYAVVDATRGKQETVGGKLKFRGRPFEDTSMLLHSYREEALELQGHGQHEEALARWRAAIDLAPKRADLWYCGGVAARSSRGLEASLPFLERATELDPTLAAAWMDLGVTIFELGRPEASLPSLERARALEPDNGRLWWNLANLHEELDQNEDARHAFARFLEIAADDDKLVEVIPEARRRLKNLAAKT
jgi:tetratricopeptide (TPR) repeat protein